MAHALNPLSGRKIRNLRRMMKLTQASAASLAEVNLSTWKRWESGKHRMPKRIFDRFVEIKTVEDIMRVARGEISLFIIDAVLDILPPVTAPIWSNKSAWRQRYGEDFDFAIEQIESEDGPLWPSHPSAVIARAMWGEAADHADYDDPIWSDETAWRSCYSHYDLSEAERDKAKQHKGSHHPRDIVYLAVSMETNKIPKVSDPIWSDEAAWRSIGRYAELHDSQDVIGMETIWPPRPRDVVALGMCLAESDSDEIFRQAWRQAERWVASDPEHRMMPDEIFWSGSVSYRDEYYPEEAEVA